MESSALCSTAPRDWDIGLLASSSKDLLAAGLGAASTNSTGRFFFGWLTVDMWIYPHICGYVYVWIYCKFFQDPDRCAEHHSSGDPHTSEGGPGRIIKKANSLAGNISLQTFFVIIRWFATKPLQY